MTRLPDEPRPEVGLCARCTQASTQRSARGSEFWRCRAADGDTRLLRYPPLPVTSCPAFQARSGQPRAPGS